jgi:hypothetical protein
MQDDSVDLWATDEVHFQQHGSRCRMWIPPEIKALSSCTPPPARVWAISGPCACGMGALCSVWKPANSTGPASCSFSSNSAPPAAEPGDGSWSSPTMPVITTPACTDRGGNTTPITLPWTSFPLTVPNSTRSSECGSSPAAAACTIATLTISKTSSARLNPSSQPGPLGTMSCVDYARLLKTLRLPLGGARPLASKHLPADWVSAIDPLHCPH